MVFAKGFGVRKLGAAARVTANALFGIASNTKAFTAASLAMLVDEGKVHWTDRVIDYLPSFQMADPYVTREMRVRDLLVHRSGLALGAGDLMFFPASDLSSDEIVKRLRYVPLATSFRSAYAYDNVLYLGRFFDSNRRPSCDCTASKKGAAKSARVGVRSGPGVPLQRSQATSARVKPTSPRS